MSRKSVLENVTSLLQHHAVGLGLTVPEIRALYPAKAVRRVSVLESLRQLEAQGAVEWRGPRVRWKGDLPGDARPLGVKYCRIERDLALTPGARMEMMWSLSAALQPPPAGGT